MRAIDIFLLAVAAVIGLLTLSVEPWSKQWWAAIIFASAIALLALAHMALNAKISLKMEVNTLGPWILIVGGPLIGLLWLYLRTPESGVSQAAKTIPTEASISIECEEIVLPKILGPSDTIKALNLFPLPIENGGSGLTTFFNNGGKEWKWNIDDDPFPATAHRCAVTNYGSGPVFDFQMYMDLTFFEAVNVENQPNTKTSGRLKLKRSWLIPVQKIDAGSANSFIFYIYNNNPDQIVTVALPKVATFRRLGYPEEHTEKLTIPKVGGEIPLYFGPRFHSEKVNSAAASSLNAIELPIGGLRYVNFIGEILRDIKANKTSIQMMVEVQNASESLVRFHARLRGSVSGKTRDGSSDLIEFDGIIPAKDTRRLMYDRIYDVPSNEQADMHAPVMSGALEYDVVYWSDAMPAVPKRRTAKRVEFDMWQPFAKEPGQVKTETTTRLSHEIEE